MASAFQRHFLKDGEVIFEKGDPGTSLYLVESGMVEVWIENGGGRRTLGMAKPGEMVGEMAVFDRQPRMASASARGATVVLQMPPSVLRQAINQADPLVVQFIEALVSRIRSMAGSA